jgi:hypothetical protein
MTGLTRSFVPVYSFEYTKSGAILIVISKEDYKIASGQDLKDDILERWQAKTMRPSAGSHGHPSILIYIGMPM